MAAVEVKLLATYWILIVDDEFDIIRIFKQALKKKGFHVFGFTDPLLAVKHFQINVKRYGLVISDPRMPAMNGYKFRSQRDQNRNKKIFIYSL